jgi:hypothetical protein
MAQTLEQQFDPAAAGFRVSTGPIMRRKRRASAKPQPKPQYADAVWYSFENDHPLEVVVPVRSVEDTVRRLKRAARYLERTHSTQAKKVEVRVQIGIEPLLGEDGQPVKPAQSTVKFLGHEPWMLGRRIAKEAASPTDTPRPAGHRRTTAATRSSQPKASLPDALVWAVITQQQPSFPVTTPVRGLLCFA